MKTEHYTAGRVSLNEGALRFYRELGVLPTTKLIRLFARNEGFALEDIDWDKRWAVQLEEFRLYIVAHLGEPRAYVPVQTQAAWYRWIAAKGLAAELGDPADRWR